VRLRIIIFIISLGLAFVFGVLSRPLIKHLYYRLNSKLDNQNKYQIMRRQQFSLLNQLSNTSKIVFWGDSILRQMELSEWIECRNIKVINRAVGSDRTEHLLTTLLDIPSHVITNIVLIGINDLNDPGIHRKPSTVAKNISRIAEILRTKTNGTVYILSLLPTNKSRLNNNIKKVNSLLLSNQNSNDYIFLDFYASFCNINGLINEKYTYDGIHLTAAGMQHFIELIKGRLSMCQPPQST